MERPEPRRVLILCTGNSCRSQMAEVLWNHHGNGNWQADSAGSRPSGYVHEKAIRAIRELGLPTDGLSSKSSDSFVETPYDLVVTVCDNARQACPVWPSAKMLLHWPFPDPADAEGTEDEVFAVFQDVRDRISRRIEDFLALSSAESMPRFTLDQATRHDATRLVDQALTEDLGSAELSRQLDVTTESVVPGNVRGAARFVSRDAGVVCGVAISRIVIERINRDLKLTVFRQDGEAVQPGDCIATLEGNAQDILIAERTCLNFMGRLSGISTLTKQFVNQVDGTGAQVLDTRKTTPGWRRLEKFAVRCGGGANHRMGLYDAVLIKDNHLAMMDWLTDQPMNEITTAISSARAWIQENAQRLPEGMATVVQIEVDRIDQFEKALTGNPDIVLLDNMSNDQLKQTVQIRDRQAANVLLEASGGVNLETIGSIAKTGVDRISVGALTHSSVNLDIGLDWKIGSDSDLSASNPTR